MKYRFQELVFKAARTGEIRLLRSALLLSRRIGIGSFGHKCARAMGAIVSRVASHVG